MQHMDKELINNLKLTPTRDPWVTQAMSTILQGILDLIIIGSDGQVLMSATCDLDISILIITSLNDDFFCVMKQF